MDQKAVVKLEVEKNERKFEFIMPIGSPYGEAYDAAFEFLNEIAKMTQEAAEAAERKTKEEAVEVKTDDDKEEKVAEAN
jgi:hypothetical protein